MSNKRGRSGVSERRVQVAKGRAAVDDNFEDHESYHVLEEEDGTIWDCMLNQTNTARNNNKFYIIQLLQRDDGAPTSMPRYVTYTRWGRVGLVGRDGVFPNSDLVGAKAAFRKKFTDKTKNRWEDRDNFVVYDRKYMLLKKRYVFDEDMEEEEEEEEEEEVESDDGETKKKNKKNNNKKQKREIPESKLDARVQDFVKLVCDVSMMKRQMVEVGYDPEKLPLGALSKEQFRDGYNVLAEIEAAIRDNKSRSVLQALSDRFYTLIPHAFGMRRLPAIDNREILLQKMDMMESLAEIDVATRLIKGEDRTENPIDEHYKSLACNMEPLDRSSDMWTIIANAVRDTHAKTHNTYRLEVVDIMELHKESEQPGFALHKGHARYLLWHGSRLTNYMGIISQGLRIAPPEAPVTGYMFGKGIYGADLVSKAANYCWATESNNTGVIILCEMAVGSWNEKFKADYHAGDLPPGKISTKGVGATAPSRFIELEGGEKFAVGKPKKDKKLKGKTDLLYNEYIVYNKNQVRLRYAITVKFNFAWDD